MSDIIGVESKEEQLDTLRSTIGGDVIDFKKFKEQKHDLTQLDNAAINNLLGRLNTALSDWANQFSLAGLDPAQREVLEVAVTHALQLYAIETVMQKGLSEDRLKGLFDLGKMIFKQIWELEAAKVKMKDSPVKAGENLKTGTNEPDNANKEKENDE